MAPSVCLSLCNYWCSYTSQLTPRIYKGPIIKVGVQYINYIKSETTSSSVLQRWSLFSLVYVHNPISPLISQEYSPSSRNLKKTHQLLYLPHSISCGGLQSSRNLEKKSQLLYLPHSILWGVLQSSRSLKQKDQLLYLSYYILQRELQYSRYLKKKRT